MNYQTHDDLSERRPRPGRALLSAVGAAGLMLLGVGILLAAATPFGATASAQDVAPAVAHRQFRRVVGVPVVDTLYVQNVATRTVEIEVQFVPLTAEGGSPVVISDTIDALSSRVYTTPESFVGGALVGTDELDAIYTANLSRTDDGSTAGLGTGVDGDQVAASVNFYRLFVPHMVRSETWLTDITIQNAGVSAGVGLFAFYNADGSQSSPSQVFMLPAGGANTFSTATLSDLSSPDLAGVIASDQPIQLAGDIQLQNAQRRLQATYAMDEGGDDYLVPVLFNGSSRQSSELCVQNTTPVDNTVVVRYTDGISRTLAALKPNASACVDQRTEGHAAGWVGGARVTASVSGESIVAAVVVTARNAEGQEIGAWAYTPANATEIAAKNIALPLVLHGAAGWESSIYLYNPGTADASVQAYFVDGSGHGPCADTFTAPAGQVTVLASDELPPHFVEGMAYFASSEPLAAALGATDGLPDGVIADRYLGYEAAYPAAVPATITTPCDPPADGAFAPEDVSYPRQQNYMEEIGVPSLWQRGLTGATPARPIVVAVVDTGVDLTHPDLAANLVAGYDFVDGDDTPQDTSAASHGTRVAGIIAAPMNNALAAGRTGAAVGIAGIGGGNVLSGTPGLKIMPLRVATDTVGIDCLLSAQAIDYAREHGVQIISMSYGDGEACPEEQAAVERAYAAGLVLVAGAGNDNSSAPFYPAAYGAGANENLVVAVAGLYPGGSKGPTSNFGPWVDLSAPYRAYSLATGGRYGWDSGTSFAAPFVSGLIGVLMSNYGLTRDAAIDLLRDTVDNVDAQNQGFAGQLGAGRINADRASAEGTAVTDALFLPVLKR